MKLRNAWWIGGLIAGTLGIAFAQAPAPVMQHTFEESDGGWQALGFNPAKGEPLTEGGKIMLVRDAANVKEGKAALQYDYQLKKEALHTLILPTPEGALTKMKSLSFWIKTSHTAPIGIALSEKGGGRYAAAFNAPKDKWQRVELSLSDFLLMRGKTDPKDPNNKLDLEQVENIGILDIGQLLVQADPIAQLLGVEAGPRKLFLDEFTVSEAALPDVTSATGGEVLLDKFARPQLAWISFGDTQLSQSSGKPLEGAGLQATYQQAPGKVVGIARAVPSGKLTGKGQLSLSAASSKPTTFIVQLEEASGGKYNTMLELPGNSEKRDVSLPFANFNPADDSQDDNGKLDLDQVTQVIFVDLSGLMGGVSQENTLWLNNFRAGAAK